MPWRLTRERVLHSGPSPRIPRVIPVERYHIRGVILRVPSGTLTLRMTAFVKGSRTPAAAGCCHMLWRQASEKPQGRKPREGVARRCRRLWG